MTDATTARTVIDLIETLQRLDPMAPVISHEPPFTGVQVVPQGDGSVYIASLWNSDEGRAERASRPATKATATPSPAIPK